MSESTIRTEIKNIISGVTDIGVVHDYERWASTDAGFIDLFRTTIGGVNQIRGWVISRKTPAGEENNEIRTHTFVIRGYMGLVDANATEKTFTALIEAACAAFRANPKLNDTAASSEYITVNAVEQRMYGTDICHFTELALTVYEDIS